MIWFSFAFVMLVLICLKKNIHVSKFAAVLLLVQHGLEVCESILDSHNSVQILLLLRLGYIKRSLKTIVLQNGKEHASVLFISGLMDHMIADYCFIYYRDNVG